jgi:1,4-dihydroxy-2-naphthoate octaprenyltransferase
VCGAQLAIVLGERLSTLLYVAMVLGSHAAVAYLSVHYARPLNLVCLLVLPWSAYLFQCMYKVGGPNHAHRM